MKNEDLKWKDTKELPIEEEQMKKLSNNMFSYGKLMENKVPFEKIKGWMYADDLIELYRNEKKQ